MKTRAMQYNQTVMFNYWETGWKQVRYIGMALEFGEGWHFIQHYDNGIVLPVTETVIRPQTREEKQEYYEGLKRQVGR